MEYEDLLLRKLSSEALGLYSPAFDAVCLSPDALEAISQEGICGPASLKAQATLTHELTHWCQYNATPWGYLLTTLLTTYVEVTEGLLARYNRAAGRIHKPLGFFLKSGYPSKEKAEDLLRLRVLHSVSLESLPLVFGSAPESGKRFAEILDILSPLFLASGHANHAVSQLSDRRLASWSGPTEGDSRALPTLEGILETWARTIEVLDSIRRRFRPAEIPDEYLATWFASKYGKLIPIFIRRTAADAQKIESILYSVIAACTTSLLSAAHPLFSDQWGGTKGGDFIPTVRFEKLLDNWNSIGFFAPEFALRKTRETELAMDEYIERMCKVMGWPGATSLACEFERQAESRVWGRTPFSEQFRITSRFIRQSPSFAVFGPMHGKWDEFLREIGGIPFFTNPALTRAWNLTAGENSLTDTAHERAFLGVRLNYVNEVMYEDGFSEFKIGHYVKGDDELTPEDWHALEELYLKPLRGKIEMLGIAKDGIHPFTIRGMNFMGEEKLAIIKSSILEDWNQDEPHHVPGLFPRRTGKVRSFLFDK